MYGLSGLFEFLYWSVVALYAAVAAGTIYFALTKPKAALRKVVASILAVAAFGVLPGMQAKEALESKQAQKEFAKYREAAWAHFRKRCKENAGEKIFQTVAGIRGIVLLRPRGQATDSELSDQYWRGDPYGRDSVLPDSEIRNFVGYLNDRNIATSRPTSKPGYLYVEVRNFDGGYRRYELDSTQRRIVSIAIDEPASRYAVTWKDISTDEDRKYWVAGGKLEIIDLKTHALVGERIGYLLEPGFGSQAGGRLPWGHARLMSSDRAACPPFRARSLLPINRLFVEKVLKPARRGGDGN